MRLPSPRAYSSNATMGKLPCASGTCGRQADGTGSQYVKVARISTAYSALVLGLLQRQQASARKLVHRPPVCRTRQGSIPSIGRPRTKHPPDPPMAWIFVCMALGIWSLGANWPNKLSQRVPHSPLPRARHPAGLPYSDVVCLARRGCFQAAHARIAAMMEAGRISVAGSSRGGKASVPCCR